jgi:serine/threonine-protein kinase
VNTFPGTLAAQTVLAEKWRLDAPIGHGGMGDVWRATELAGGRTVAIKLMNAQLAENPEVVARFEREARLLSKLDHPSLVPLLSVDRHDGVPFIVLEFLRGQTLADLLEARTRFAVRQLLPLLQQLCGALDYLHARGIVHRDLKPRNIMVDADDHLTLLDFGVSRHLEASRLTRPGMVVGTPMYMAPEQILTDDAAAPADIYALALMTWQLLVGEHPFGDTRADAHVMRRQIGELPMRATLKNPAVPEPVARVLERSLQKDPQSRHPTAMAFYDDLVKAFGRDHTVDASERNLPPAERPRAPLPVVPLVLGAALALGAALYFFLR